VKQYKKLITKGIKEPLQNVPFHGRAPIKRLLMLDKKLIPQSDVHVAVHFVNPKKKMPQYSKMHKHNVDEINLILSENGKLSYEIQLEGETYRVSSPATIFIPKGIRHRAQVISGKGIFVCVILSSNYKSS
jgi:cupin superfamily acireductone dioxygenase involved in methionine salvage